MSPRAAAEFGKQWPAVERRLRSFLRKRGVVSNEIDDLVQEVATRLLTIWHKVDRSRSVWPLTATIALNLLRDRSRRRDFELIDELPDVAGPFDAAQAGLAKLELAEVLRAMDELTPSQRNALLHAIEAPTESTSSTSAEKMLRMRARRRLANVVGRASAGLSLKLRRVGDALSALFTRTDGVAQALACATCLFVTGAGTASIYPSFEGFGGSRPQIASELESAAQSSVSLTYLEASGTEGLSPDRAAYSKETAGAASAGTAATKKATDEAPDETTKGTSLDLPQGAPVPGAPPMPGDMPASPPDAPDQPTEAPSSVQTDGSIPDETPIQAPSDAPIDVVDEVSGILRK